MKTKPEYILPIAAKKSLDEFHRQREFLEKEILKISAIPKDTPLSIKKIKLYSHI